MINLNSKPGSNLGPLEYEVVTMTTTLNGHTFAKVSLSFYIQTTELTVVNQLDSND